MEATWYVTVLERQHRSVAASALRLLDADEASWSSWNRYAEQFAADTGARIVRVDDGGVTGPTFFEHVRRLRRPVLNNPKGQSMQEPSGLLRRSVVHPTPLWTWSLVWRSGEDSPAVRAVIDELTRDAQELGTEDNGAWLPAADPHRPTGIRTEADRPPSPTTAPPQAEHVKSGGAEEVSPPPAPGSGRRNIR